MALFLTIREGKAPDDSYPILATADPDIIEGVARILVARLSKDRRDRVVSLPTKGGKQSDTTDVPDTEE